MSNTEFDIVAEKKSRWAEAIERRKYLGINCSECGKYLERCYKKHISCTDCGGDGILNKRIYG